MEETKDNSNSTYKTQFDEIDINDTSHLKTQDSNSQSTKSKHKIKNEQKVVKKKKNTYRTQCLKVGEVKCLFLSWYKQGRTPLLTLGPSWPFTIVLILFGVFLAVFFIFMSKMIKHKSVYTELILYSLIIINITALFMGILQNPGISQQIFDIKLKQQLGKNTAKGVSDQFDEDSESDEDDLESVGQKKKVDPKAHIYYNNIKSPLYQYCKQCQVQYDRETYHCEDCDVCIKGYDHHCIFFGKCIGEGNLCSFWTTIALVFVSFVVFSGFVFFDFYQRANKTDSK
ncbi:dhhc zinc finger domain containing protein [Stylonychia lemnae]|uniref:Palmitoyltransferase n=1 Tax=Stylonychia lemnae TaxID=5949 RepID=A0A078A9N9_STYLE|nr:dhhc zinc finger domain containing protein [Stylonychia lemnae]|eukprot:CDW77513.1 dhhc zinc finger domain containing protein [Stylonychia lemnae]